MWAVAELPQLPRGRELGAGRVVTARLAAINPGGQVRTSGPWGVVLSAHLAFYPLFPGRFGPGTKGRNHREGKKGVHLSPFTRSKGQSCILGGLRGLPGQRASGSPGRKGPSESGHVRFREVVTGPRSPSS